MGSHSSQPWDITSSCQFGHGFTLLTSVFCFSLLVPLFIYFYLLQRLFFLNGEQDLSTFLLVDLGIVKYPAYNCIISEQIFSNRSDLLSFEEVHLIYCQRYFYLSLTANIIIAVC